MSEFKLVPAKMLLDKETIGVINFHCGDGADGQFGEYSDGFLWVGTVTDDEGKGIYGLHLSTAEYPEEGSSTLIVFEEPKDAAHSELAALREELEKSNTAHNVAAENHLALNTTIFLLEQRLTAAEQRNAKLESLLNAVKPHIQWSLHGDIYLQIKAALKPTESGASE